jgi:hypothetical protein
MWEGMVEMEGEGGGRKKKREGRRRRRIEFLPFAFYFTFFASDSN